MRGLRVHKPTDTERKHHACRQLFLVRGIGGLHIRYGQHQYRGKPQTVGTIHGSAFFLRHGRLAFRHGQRTGSRKHFGLRLVCTSRHPFVGVGGFCFHTILRP